MTERKETAEFKPIKMAVSHGPDLRFDGKLIHQYTTQRADGGKDRWTELRLWETPAGNWVAESVGCSSRRGEGEIREARVIEVLVFRPEDADRFNDCSILDDRRVAVMDHFQWTSAAKAFAREMGWSVVREVP